MTGKPLDCAKTYDIASGEYETNRANLCHHIWGGTARYMNVVFLRRAGKQGRNAGQWVCGLAVEGKMTDSETRRADLLYRYMNYVVLP